MNKTIIFLILNFVAIVTVLSIVFIIDNYENDNTTQNFVINEESNVDQPTNHKNVIDNTIKRKDNIELYIKVNNRILTTTLENNSSVDALVEELEKQDITINMEDYANFEKVGSLGFSLTKNDKQITTEPGDIILYQGNQLAIYYDINSWNFTKIGHIDNINQKELKQILGKGNVTVTLSLERK